MLPEFHAGDVIIHDENIALPDAFRQQRIQACSHEGGGDAAFAMVGANGQVTQDAAPAFVTRENGADDLVADECHETGMGISSQIESDAFRAVVIAEHDALGGLPQAMDAGVIGERHEANGMGHIRWV